MFTIAKRDRKSAIRHVIAVKQQVLCMYLTEIEKRETELAQGQKELDDLKKFASRLEARIKANKESLSKHTQKER